MLREKLQQGADHPACAAACARFRLRVLQAETMRQSSHAAGKVARVHGKRDGLGFEEALEDSRQGAGLLILQRVISFCEDGIRRAWSCSSVTRSGQSLSQCIVSSHALSAADSWCGGRLTIRPSSTMSRSMYTRNSSRKTASLLSKLE